MFGTPIGHPAWEQQRLRALLSEHRASLRALATLGNPQASQHLLVHSQATRITHLLRSMPPEATRELALAHDDQLWVAFGHVTGHLSDAETAALLHPLADPGAWPARGGHWLQAALGEPPHPATMGPSASVADRARQQAQFRRADGGFSLGNASAVRAAAFVGSWALAIQEGLLSDFPEVGLAVRAPAADRIPYVAALGQAWAEVAEFLPEGAVRDCPAGAPGHEGHGGLDCFLALSVAPAPGRAPGVVPPGRFADHLQRRLSRRILGSLLQERDDEVSQAWQMAPTQVGRDALQATWGRLFATSMTCASLALTTLPDEPGDYGHRNMAPRRVHGHTCLRLGIPLPDIGFGPPLTVCRLHNCNHRLPNGLGHHFVHCGRLTPHGMHTALEAAFAYVAQNVPGLIVKSEVCVLPGSGARMDLVITNPLAAGGMQTLMVDVTMGTAMGAREYAGTPRHGARLERGWRGERRGSAARRAEAYKEVKYAVRIREAGGGAIFEGACVEDYGGFGEGARQVLKFIGDAAFGPGPSSAKDLFQLRGAQHIAVYAANAVVAAHDSNVLHMKGLNRLARLARGTSARTPDRPDELMHWVQETQSGPGSRAAQRLASSMPEPSETTTPRYRRPPPARGGAPHADSRPMHMSLGASSDSLRMAGALPGLSGAQGAGPLMGPC